MKLLINSINMQIDSGPTAQSPGISVENAATKIQAGFRGYRVRKQLKEFTDCDETTLIDHSQTHLPIIVPPQPTTQIERDAVICNGCGVEDRSATKIQAGIRGYLVRKKQKLVGDAATKIQAGFRGFKVRKELQKQREVVN